MGSVIIGNNILLLCIREAMLRSHDDLKNEAEVAKFKAQDFRRRKWRRPLLLLTFYISFLLIKNEMQARIFKANVIGACVKEFCDCFLLERFSKPLSSMGLISLCATPTPQWYRSVSVFVPYCSGWHVNSEEHEINTNTLLFIYFKSLLVQKPMFQKRDNDAP